MNLLRLFRRKSREDVIRENANWRAQLAEMQRRTDSMPAPQVGRCPCGSMLWFESERRRGTCHDCEYPLSKFGLPRPRRYPPMPRVLPPRKPTMTTDNELEKMIQEKGLTAPRVTPESIEAIIRAEVYFTAAEAANATGQLKVDSALGKALGLLTFCVLHLENGFTVTGESACASPANFNQEVGRKAARENAVNKLWALEGYRLKQRLYDEASGVIRVDDPLPAESARKVEESFRAPRN